ncbi:hypothetical protein CI109_104058 [Kwoniella shandongensis]|uniref:Uncharacterized protein n=1 Tax=Kwoniella shandongensis TaxID=1734106 RepID=A0A5M6BXC5_9TREE|nr:uncharacterized protein CI109_004056 [Kwoniella shandongensis]KAA5527518.1 hypothetical protein CI109_004056 [Kwoniella shandongensis]
MSQDFTEQLQHAHELIKALLDHIHSFPVERLLYHAPILDRIRWDVWKQDEVMGLKKFIEGVEHHERLIAGMIRSGVPPQDDPIPSVQGLTTFWKIIITSPPPIVGVRMAMGGDRGRAFGSGPSSGMNKAGKASQGVGSQGKGKEKEKEKEVWVDVIAKGGMEWVRIYSKKISHLLAEFREIDSYINSDFDSDSDSNSDPNGGGESSSSRDHELTNSLITTARDLIRASYSIPRIPGAAPPSITLRLTRIPSSSSELEGFDNDDGEWPDDRIPKSFDIIRSMGINLLFGDLSSLSLSTIRGHPIPARPLPSLRLNFDITALMGLCSDVLHHPLPENREEAARRSLRPEGHLIGDGTSTPRGRDGTGRGKGKGKKEEVDEEEIEVVKGQSQNSVELYRCILEEMDRPFIEEFDKVIRDAWSEMKGREKVQTRDVPDNSDSNDEVEELTNEDNLPHVQFWTTKQAAQYTYEALNSGPAHGYGGEQRRMLRMLGLEEGDFFEGSRYEGNEGILKGFKVKIFDEIEQVKEDDTVNAPGADEEMSDSLLPSWNFEKSNLEGREISRPGLDITLEAITKTFLDEYYLSTKANHKVALPNFLQPKKMPTPPVAKISLPFPVVSLHSLHRGAKEGMTTVMMGTATLKEVWGQTRWRIRGWERAGYVWEEENQLDGGSNGQEEEEEERREKGFATVMIFPYRVFGEGKRVRFEQGDYSYPLR